MNYSIYVLPHVVITINRSGITFLCTNLNIFKILYWLVNSCCSKTFLPNLFPLLLTPWYLPKIPVPPPVAATKGLTFVPAQRWEWLEELPPMSISSKSSKMIVKFLILHPIISTFYWQWIWGPERLVTYTKLLSLDILGPGFKWRTGWIKRSYLVFHVLCLCYSKKVCSLFSLLNEGCLFALLHSYV